MTTTALQLKEIVYEELLDERNSIIIKEEFKRIDLLHERMERDLSVLYEEWGWKDAAHIGLDVIGLIPYVGAPADIANALWYFSDEEFLMGALSLIAVIPVVGDIIGVGGKFAVKGSTKATAWMGKQITKHMPKISTAFTGLAKTNPKLAPYMTRALDALKGFGRRMVMAPSAADTIALAAKASKVKPVKKVAGMSKAAYKKATKKALKKKGMTKKQWKTAQKSAAGKMTDFYIPKAIAKPSKWTKLGPKGQPGKILRKGINPVTGKRIGSRGMPAQKYTLGLPRAFMRNSRAMGLSRLRARALDRIFTRAAVGTTGALAGGAYDVATGQTGYGEPGAYATGYSITSNDQEELETSLTSVMQNIDAPGAREVAQKIWDMPGFDRDAWCAANSDEFDC